MEITHLLFSFFYLLDSPYFSLSLHMSACLHVSIHMCAVQSGIRPMWEDKGNVDGGRWLWTMEKRGGVGDKKEILDGCWIETVSRDGGL